MSILSALDDSINLALHATPGVTHGMKYADAETMFIIIAIISIIIIAIVFLKCLLDDD